MRKPYTTSRQRTSPETLHPASRLLNLPGQTSRAQGLEPQAQTPRIYSQRQRSSFHIRGDLSPFSLISEGACDHPLQPRPYHPCERRELWLLHLEVPSHKHCSAAPNSSRESTQALPFPQVSQAAYLREKASRCSESLLESKRPRSEATSGTRAKLQLRESKLQGAGGVGVGG